MATETTTAAAPAAASVPASAPATAPAPALGSSPLEELVQGAELEACKELQQRVPEASPGQVVRFLRARDGKVDDAETFLKANLAWRKETLPIEPTTEVRAELEKLKFLIYGKDKEGRLIVLVRSKVMGKHTYEDLEIVKKATVILAEYVEHLAGPIGLMTVVYSRLDATRKNMDFDVVKVVAGLMQDNYPERLHQAMAAPTGPLLRGAWKVVQLFFDPRTRAKLCLVKDVDGFKDAVDASSLPTEIGGTCTEPLSVQPIIEFAEQAWAASRTET